MGSGVTCTGAASSSDEPLRAGEPVGDHVGGSRWFVARKGMNGQSRVDDPRRAPVASNPRIQPATPQPKTFNS